jgi:hypothetical protein
MVMRLCYAPVVGASMRTAQERNFKNGWFKTFGMKIELDII